MCECKIDFYFVDKLPPKPLLNQNFNSDRLTEQKLTFCSDTNLTDQITLNIKIIDILKLL